jgi:hypothetical protein
LQTKFIPYICEKNILVGTEALKKKLLLNVVEAAGAPEVVITEQLV